MNISLKVCLVTVHKKTKERLVVQKHVDKLLTHKHAPGSAQGRLELSALHKSYLDSGVSEMTR